VVEYQGLFQCHVGGTVEKIEAHRGRGRVRIAPDHDIEVYYEIGIWRTADGALHFEGRIETDTVTTSAIGRTRGPISLTLSDGTVIDVVASERELGQRWAEIHVPVSAPSIVPAAWPTRIVR